MDFAERALGIFKIFVVHFKIGKGLPAFNPFICERYIDGFTIAVLPDGYAAREFKETDLGTKLTTEFDYGSKTSTEDGEHSHKLTANVPTTRSNSQAISGGSVAVWTGSLATTVDGLHAHVTEIGPHAHAVEIGSHGHEIIIDESGNVETTVKNIACNYIVRLA